MNQIPEETLAEWSLLGEKKDPYSIVAAHKALPILLEAYQDILKNYTILSNHLKQLYKIEYQYCPLCGKKTHDGICDDHPSGWIAI